MKSSKRVLVTGASGFTGSQLALTLARRGYHVRAMVRQDSDRSLISPNHGQPPGIELVTGDLRSDQDVGHAVDGCDHVYHIAALYRSARFPDQTYWDVNVGGTQRVFDACRRFDIARVLHCSTIGVHGGIQEIPGNEQSAFAPDDIYQRTKLEGEHRAQEAIAHGMPVTIIRPAGIYGPGDRRFLKLFSLVKSGRFIMFGSGETLMHMVYIDDLVEGLIQANEHPDGIGKAMILAGPEYVSLKELVRMVAMATNVSAPRWRLPLWPLMAAAVGCESLCRLVGMEPPLHRRRAAFFTKNRAFSIDFAKHTIGYQPSTGLQDGLRKTALWYQRENLLA